MPRLQRLAILALLCLRLLSLSALAKAGTAGIPAAAEKIDYLLLDPVDFYDRAGRKTHYERDAMRRVREVTDPANRSVSYQRLACCGTVDVLLDANHHSTEGSRIGGAA
jgi:YD repeat-containing protein